MFDIVNSIPYDRSILTSNFNPVLRGFVGDGMVDPYTSRHCQNDSAHCDFFGSDSSRSDDNNLLPKIYLRTLLFSTSKQGRIVESMHVALWCNETHQNFNIWVYGERDKFVRGSGIFVGETGIAVHHHFLTPKDGNNFQFTEGKYKIDVVVRLLGESKSIKLFLKN